MREIIRFTLLCTLLPIVRASAQGQPAAVVPDTIPWVAVSHTPGAHVRWLVGRTEKSGVYAFQVKFEAGAKGAPHTHPDTRYTLVLKDGPVVIQESGTNPTATDFVQPTGRPQSNR